LIQARRLIKGLPRDGSVSWPGNGSGRWSGKWIRQSLGDESKPCQEIDQSEGQDTDQEAGQGNGSDTGYEMNQGLANRWISQLAKIRIRKMVRELDQTQARRRLRV
jgi:hypothetical protein